MNKDQKVNWIKGWLQKFGNRDNDTFHTEVTVGGTNWEISLQYDYGYGGEKYEPYDWCSNGFKHVYNNTISDRTDDELDSIITVLKSRDNYLITRELNYE